jgi:hypothetical protein
MLWDAGVFFVICFNSRITSSDLFKYKAEKIFYYSMGLLFVCAFIGDGYVNGDYYRQDTEK